MNGRGGCIAYSLFSLFLYFILFFLFLVIFSISPHVFCIFERSTTLVEKCMYTVSINLALDSDFDLTLMTVFFQRLYNPFQAEREW